ncbi:MAG: hypothetical protein ACW99U_10100 [Candidatus Thorarchaeota archaeon]
MSTLSPKGVSKDTVFLQRVCDLSRRGDFDTAKDSLRAFFKDKKTHPWHRLNSILESRHKITKDPAMVSENLILVRDAVFASLDMLSLSLVLDVSYSAVLDVVTTGKTWKDGRRNARSFCSKMASDMIDSGKIGQIVSSALDRDGLGFLIPSLHEKQIDKFRKARPKVKAGKLSLRPLAKTKLGRELLKELGMVEEQVPNRGKQAKQLKEAYEHRLLELEIDGQKEQIPADTFQITLNGEVVEDTAEDLPHQRRGKEALGVQTPLTEYADSKAAKKETPKRRRMKAPGTKRRRKKSGTKEGGK